MSDDLIDYGRLIDEAMHEIVKRTLRIVEKHGLPDEHHFFITFQTHYPGVMISDELKERYPEEMTIVIQHQYWDLQIEEDRFSLVLSFNNVKENLTVPFQAITSFADPSVKFGLQFRNALDEEGMDDEGGFGSGTASNSEGPDDEVSDGSNIVSLDSFRKK